MDATIRQSDFAKKHGIAPLDMKSMRDRWLSEGSDWEKRGVPIYLTLNAVKVLESALNVAGDAVEEPEVKTALAIKKCPNQRMLYAALDGIQIVVNCGKKRDKLLKKKINVRLEPGQTVYSYVP